MTSSAIVCDVISQNINRMSETQGWCVKIVILSSSCHVREINIKKNLSWAHKQFATQVHTLCYIYFTLLLFSRVVFIYDCIPNETIYHLYFDKQIQRHQPKNDMSYYLYMHLVPDGTKPLPEPILTYHQWGPVVITWGQFHIICLSHQLFKLARKLIS